MSTFENAQKFDFDGIKGRLLSSSYVPNDGEPTAVPMLEHLKKIFEKHQTTGRVRIEYDTRVYFGKLAAP